MNREEALETVIRIYGFEHEITIGFAKLCENPCIPDSVLATLAKAHEVFPYYGEEEED